MYIFIERILEEKKRLNLSAKTMADISRLHLSEETIKRVLSGKTPDPGISTILDISESVGLKPYEAFMDATLATEFEAFLSLKQRDEHGEVERIKLTAENETLKATNAGLVDRIRVLEMQLQHKEELLAVKDELLSTKKDLLSLVDFYIKKANN